MEQDQNQGRATAQTSASPVARCKRRAGKGNAAGQSAASSSGTPPFRQIRAVYDAETITVYQAYSRDIGDAAVAAQKLNASPLFSLDRITWIKPSWCWMMYRSGYSYKDPCQACILAIKMKHENFLKLLAAAELTHHGSLRNGSTKVQWDPERSPAIERLPYRSIQIGVPVGTVPMWVAEWIEQIDDVTERARALKAALDENKKLTREELVERGLVPEEREYELPMELRERLEMNQ